MAPRKESPNADINDQIEYISLCKELTKVETLSKKNTKKSKQEVKESLIRVLGVVMDFKKVHDALHTVFDTLTFDISELSGEKFKTLSSEEVQRRLRYLSEFFTKSRQFRNAVIWKTFEYEESCGLKSLSNLEQQNFWAIQNTVLGYKQNVDDVHFYKGKLLNMIEQGELDGLRSTVQSWNSALRSALRGADELIFNSLPFVDFIAQRMR